MTNKHEISLFIFRRDLRLDDNMALLKAASESKKVIPMFIFTPAQISNDNKFKSSNAIQFMIECLYELDEDIQAKSPKSRLWVQYSDEISAIKKIHQKINFSAIYINTDYTPYAKERDALIKKFCDKNEIEFNSETDQLLIGDNEVKANNGNAYHVYGLFYKRAVQFPVRKPNKFTHGNIFLAPISNFSNQTVSSMDKLFLKKEFYTQNDNIAINGGRSGAIDLLENFANYKNYSDIVDIPSIDTTMLSAHLKFGTVSVREVYQYFKKDKSGEMHKKLYWRDFYYYVSMHFENFYKHEYLLKNVPLSSTAKLWSNNSSHFKAWKKGRTGFPMVDAAMTELNTTGFMHNRGRLVVSEFLVKDLRINWKYGERYFASKLIDIDRTQNVGNWNWSSSFGLDSTPFLRIFNPWTQSKKFDGDCKYIKKWLPQLEPVENNHIHLWYKHWDKYDIDYPEPIVDHTEEAAITRKLFKKHIYQH